MKYYYQVRNYNKNNEMRIDDYGFIKESEMIDLINNNTFDQIITGSCNYD
jgi:hypothetical protein